MSLLHTRPALRIRTPRLQTTRWTPVAFIAAAVAALVILLLLLGAAPARAISRGTVLSRAQVRVDKPVPYSQSRYYAGYRTDCSGYVSMCWATGSSYNTRSMYKITTPIKPASLKPGDAMLRPGYHVRLFYDWLDESRTYYVAYESAGNKIAGVRIHSLAEDLRSGYSAVRYDRISDSAASQNVLKNGSFNTWTSDWGSSALRPVWWQLRAPLGGTVATRRQDTYRSARNSLRLTNTSADPLVKNELLQEVRVVAGADYRLTAYARSRTASSAIELRLAYLDAYGNTLAETSTVGSRARIDDTGFKPMAVLLTAPAGTVRARATVSLAGAATTTTAGVATTGTALALDDISLVRPRLSVGAKCTSTSVRKPSTINLSGTVWPARSVGATATVYVKRPGGAWSRLTTTQVSPSGSAAVWKARYAFRGSMPLGTYYFRTSVAGIPGYLGATSKTVSVRLR